MRMRAALVMAATLVVCLAGEAFGQGFQGGLRGAISRPPEASFQPSR